MMHTDDETAAIGLTTSILLVAAMATGCGLGDSDGDSETRSCATIETADPLQGGGTLADESCYLVTDTVAVDAGEVTIEGGTTVYFAAVAGLSVTGDARLTIRGTDAEPAVLRGEESGRGFWRGIRLESAGPHRIEGARIADAGAGRWDQDHPRHHGGVVAAGDAELEITDAVFERHARAAVVGDDTPASTMTVEATHFEDNDAPMALPVGHLDGLGADLTFADNRTEAVRIDAEAPLTEDAAWTDLEVPYQFDEPVRLEASADVAAGTAVTFERHAGLDVDGGTLTASGTDDNPIRFVGANDIPGYWRGLRFRNTPSAADKSRLEHVEVLHAGSERWTYEWSNSQANVLVHDGGRLIIEHARIADGNYHGISIRDGIIERCDDVEFDAIYRHWEHTEGADEKCE